MARLEVEIVANTQGADRVVRSLKEIRAASGQTGTSLAGVTKQAQVQNTTLTATSATLTGTANAYNGLTVATQRQGLALQTNIAANTRYNTSLQGTAAAATATTRSTGLLTAAYSRLTGAVSAATAATTAFVRASGTAALRGLTNAATAAAGAFRSLATTSINLGPVFTALGVGATASFGIAVKEAKEFELSLSRIEGLVGIAKDEVESFVPAIEEIGRATNKGPNELAEALFFVTSAGFEGAEAIDVLEASAKAAAAGLGETKTVADAVTSAVNAYGLENLKAAEATDVLVATVREGKAEADSIAGALGQVLPAASELGVEFAELGGTIAALTRIGLNAEQGSTALAATLSAIQKPGKDAKEALLEFGTSATELRRAVREEGLLPALQSLQERFGDNEEALTRVFPNIRALRAILPLVGKNAGDVADIFDAVADSTNATDNAFQAYADTAGAQLDSALTDVSFALREIGEVLLPAVAVIATKVAGLFEDLADGVSRLSVVTKGASEAFAEFVTGPDDPLIQTLNNIREIEDELDRLAGGGNLRRIFTEVGGIDLSGSREEQVAQLEEQLQALRVIENQLGREELARQRVAAATREQGEELEEIVVNIERRGQTTGVGDLIDQEELDKGKEALADLRAEVSLLSADLSNLGELGQGGIGIAEDAATAEAIFTALQGQVNVTKEEVLRLVQAKRDLENSIAAVNARFQEQEAAVETVEEIRRSIEQTNELLVAAQQGETALFQAEALQQAREIFQALPADTELTVEAIQSLILAEQALNDQLDQTQEKFRNSNDVIEQFSIQAARNIQTAFADFLFDPLDEGLDGLVFKFAESLKKIAAEILANQILTQFFNALGSFGGPLGTIAQAGLSVLGGNQFGGNVQAGVPGIVNEDLSARGEVFVPATDGRIVTKAQAREALGGGSQEPPQVNITNVTDPAQAVAALNTPAGEQAIINTIKANPQAIKRALT